MFMFDINVNGISTPAAVMFLRKCRFLIIQTRLVRVSGNIHLTTIIIDEIAISTFKSDQIIIIIIIIISNELD